MIEVLFKYNEKEIIIKCKLEDKIKDIINKFKNKIKEKAQSLCYIYNGDNINDKLNLKLNQIIKDKSEIRINILVNNNNNIILSEIRCPECNENVLQFFKELELLMYLEPTTFFENEFLLLESIYLTKFFSGIRALPSFFEISHGRSQIPEILH